METLWFWLIALMLGVYVVLDGFDLGVGILHLLVAKTDDERRTLIRSVGPVWDGNEVWLLAAGGALVLAFPALYASAFSGFYLPLNMVLWLLILRALALELRGHTEAPMFRSLWDVGFAAASLLLALFYGAALGNVIRGVPLDAQGRFFQALWADPSRAGRETGILDPYTLLVGITALVALAVHGGLWIRLKTEGSLHARASLWVARLWWALIPLTAALTVASLRLQPQILENLRGSWWGGLFPLLAVAGLVATRAWLRPGRDRAPFLASCAFLAGMLLSAAFGVYPKVLPSVGDPALSLTVQSAAAGDYALRVALGWWIPGMLLATGYFVFLYRKTAGKIALDADGH